MPLVTTESPYIFITTKSPFSFIPVIQLTLSFGHSIRRREPAAAWNLHHEDQIIRERFTIRWFASREMKTRKRNEQLRQSWKTVVGGDRVVRTAEQSVYNTGARLVRGVDTGHGGAAPPARSSVRHGVARGTHCLRRLAVPTLVRRNARKLYEARSTLQRRDQHKNPSHVSIRVLRSSVSPVFGVMPRSCTLHAWFLDILSTNGKTVRRQELRRGSDSSRGRRTRRTPVHPSLSSNVSE